MTTIKTPTTQGMLNAHAQAAEAKKAKTAQVQKLPALDVARLTDGIVREGSASPSMESHPLLGELKLLGDQGDIAGAATELGQLVSQDKPTTPAAGRLETKLATLEKPASWHDLFAGAKEIKQEDRQLAQKAIDKLERKMLETAKGKLSAEQLAGVQAFADKVKVLFRDAVLMKSLGLKAPSSAPNSTEAGTSDLPNGTEVKLVDASKGMSPALASADIEELVQIVMMECAQDSDKDLMDLVHEMQKTNANKQAMRAYMAKEKEERAKIGSAVRAEYDRRTALDPDDPAAIDPSLTSYDDFSKSQMVVDTGTTTVDADGIPRGGPAYQLSPNTTNFPHKPKVYNDDKGVPIPQPMVDLAQKLNVKDPGKIVSLERYWQAHPELIAVDPTRADATHFTSFEEWLVAPTGVQLATDGTRQDDAVDRFIIRTDPVYNTNLLTTTYGLSAGDARKLTRLWDQEGPAFRQAYGNSIETFVTQPAPFGPALQSGVAPSGATATIDALVQSFSDNDALDGPAQTYGLARGQVKAARAFFGVYKETHPKVADLGAFLETVCGCKPVAGDQSGVLQQQLNLFATDPKAYPEYAQDLQKQSDAVFGPGGTKDNPKEGSQLRKYEDAKATFDEARVKQTVWTGAFTLCDAVSSAQQIQSEVNNARSVEGQLAVAAQSKSSVTQGLASDASGKIADIRSKFSIKQDSLGDWLSRLVSNVAQHLPAAGQPTYANDGQSAIDDALKVNHTLPFTGDSRKKFAELVKAAARKVRATLDAAQNDVDTATRNVQSDANAKKMWDEYVAAWKASGFVPTPPSIWPPTKPSDPNYTGFEFPDLPYSADYWPTGAVGPIDAPDFDASKYGPSPDIVAAMNAAKSALAAWSADAGVDATRPKNMGPTFARDSGFNAMVAALQAPLDHALKQPPHQDVAGEVSLDGLDAGAAEWQGRYDTLGDLSQTQGIRMQMYQDRRSKFYEMLSNTMKKISDASASIVQNLK